MNVTRPIRLLAGVAVSISVILVLDQLEWKIDITRFSTVQAYLLLAGTAAIGMFAASLAGAYVARSKFVGPASVLAIGMWLLAASFLSAVSMAYEPSNLVPYVVANLGGLTLTVGGAILGAILGKNAAVRWFRDSFRDT